MRTTVMPEPYTTAFCHWHCRYHHHHHRRQCIIIHVLAARHPQRPSLTTFSAH